MANCSYVTILIIFLRILFDMTHILIKQNVAHVCNVYPIVIKCTHFMNKSSSLSYLRVFGFCRKFFSIVCHIKDVKKIFIICLNEFYYK